MCSRCYRIITLFLLSLRGKDLIDLISIKSGNFNVLINGGCNSQWQEAYGKSIQPFLFHSLLIRICHRKHWLGIKVKLFKIMDINGVFDSNEILMKDLDKMLRNWGENGRDFEENWNIGWLWNFLLQFFIFIKYI